MSPTDDLIGRARAWRHHLHRHPETAFEEDATSDFVASVLTGLGATVTRGVGGTGLVGTLGRGGSGRAIALRADMDALPLHEDAAHDHVSRNPGAMHACGHDGHMAMLLGAAATLARDGGFDGSVHLVFQPAEEPGRGARAMVADDLFDRFPVAAMYGLHNIPGLPVGHLHVRPGPIMASEDNFTIDITGRGGHASAPHLVVDPIVIGAQVVLALQGIVARSVDPLATAVVSCTQFVTDGARNAIPDTVRITGDTRSYDRATQALLERRIREIASGIAAAHGATVGVRYTHEFAPTVNDAACAARVASAAIAALGTERVVADCAPIMASEDFGVYAEHVPACFAFIGNGKLGGEQGSAPLHSRGYDFNDDALAAGIAVLTRIVRDELAPA